MITNYLVENLEIPFRVSFKHHSATRLVSQTILVRLVGDDWDGWGESCPRAYVSGESCESATQQIHAWLKQGIPFFDLASWNAFCQAHKASIENNPAAFCALELAFFDGYSKKLQSPVSSILGWKSLTNTFKFTAVLGDSSLPTFQSLAKAHLDWGFTSFKVKISGNQDADFEKLRWLIDQNSKLSIRLDANNGFSSVEQVVDYLGRIPIRIEALEEPLESKSPDDLIQLIQQIDQAVILDEMAIHEQDLDKYSSVSPQIWINLRVSKMGGIQSTYRILKKAEKLGYGIVVGSQVGETSLLGHAGLLIAQQVENLIALEGGYSDLFLQQDPFEPQVKFDSHGEFHGENLAQTIGLGNRIRF
jgi:L-alanine-DL-glutamate epimerase-like enolase superfamily enzyme